MKIEDFKKLIKETLDEFRSGKNKMVLKESSLSRLFRHIEENDCAIISASRADPEDTTLCVDSPDDVLKGANNKVRSRDLKANLLAAGFGVTAVDGSYIENFNTPEAYEVKEDSFFCANLKNDPNFVEIIIGLGKKYCQDSVLVIPQGGENAYLYGTNNAEFPGDDHTIPLGKVRYGDEDEFMTKIRGRPMTIKETKLETYEDLSKNQRMAVKAISKVFLEEIKKKED